MQRPVEVEVVPGNRKHCLLAVEGNLFMRNKAIIGGVSYRCKLHNKRRCKVILHRLEDKNILYGEHTHGPNHEKIKARKIIEAGKSLVRENRFVTTREALATINNMATTSGLNGGYIGSTKNLTRRITDVRFKAHGRVSLGETREDVVIPDEFQKTNDGRMFLLHDNGGRENRMLIYATADALDKLSFCDTWLVDGTFKSCPKMFAQLYTVHGLYRQTEAVPFVYAYLPGKSKEIYKEFFEVIRRKVTEEPKVIISDFEDGAIQAMREIFVATELNGCLFHFTQNIWRRVQQSGHNDETPSVLDRYKADNEDGKKVNDAIRSLGALAFLPIGEVVAGFYEIRGLFRPDDPVRSILSSFADTYLGYDWDEVRFPIHFWSVRSRFLANQPRTNNDKEGWHFRLNSMLPSPKPALHISLEMIQKEESTWKLECDKIRQGIVRGKKASSVRLEKRLKEIHTNRENQVYATIKDFLNEIQTCLHDFLDD